MIERPEPSKGKAKEIMKETDSRESLSKSQDSMLNRVTQSAVGLMRSTWDSERHSSVTSNLATWHSSPGKGDSSSQQPQTSPSVGSTRSWKQSKTQALDSANAEFTALPSCVSKVTSNGQEEFERFIAGSSNDNKLFEVRAPLGPPQTSYSDPSNDLSRLSAKVGDSMQDCNLFAHEDGGAVVALLSSRGPLLDDEPTEVSYLKSCQIESSEELSKRTKQTDPALNLIPLWQENVFQPITQQEEASINLMSTELAPPDVRPWLEMLDTYQDEVWGDKLAFVQAARLEVEKKREAGYMDPQTLVQGPAFRRLKLLLSHIEHPI